MHVYTVTAVTSWVNMEIPSHNYNCVCVAGVIMFQIYSLENFQGYNTVKKGFFFFKQQSGKEVYRIKFIQSPSALDTDISVAIPL